MTPFRHPPHQYVKRLRSEWRQAEERGGTQSGAGREEELQDCLGDCGAKANVKIVKCCTTCEERDGCACAPSWYVKTFTLCPLALLFLSLLTPAASIASACPLHSNTPIA